MVNPSTSVTDRRIQLTIRWIAIVPTSCRFLPDRRRRNCLRDRSLRLSRLTGRGISNAGDPSRPVFVRTSPSIGIMVLFPIRQFSPILPPAG